MDPTGFALSIVSEVRTNAKSLKERYDCYRNAPELFQNVSHAMARVADDAEKLDAILRRNPDALPEDARDLFFRNLSAVNEVIVRQKADCERLETRLGSAGSGSSGAGLFKRMYRRVGRAKSLDKELKRVEIELKDAQGKLQTHLTQLIQSLKIDDAVGKLASLQVNAKSAPDEAYCAANDVPPLQNNLCFNFDSQEDTSTGKHFRAPEGNLRFAVLSSTTNSVIAACGRPKASGSTTSHVHGVSGMAGVGKTTALIALGHDELVLSHFKDGVLFIRLGADITEGLIIKRLARIMQVTGAKDSAEAVRCETNLEEAVSGASLWFRGRCNLFLFDDVWPAPMYTQGYIPVLRNILTGSPASRIAITTRSRDLDSAIVSYVDFAARDIETSRDMFFRYATSGTDADSVHRLQDLPSVQGMLRLCAGLPIALAATGLVVAAKVRNGYEFEIACKMYHKDLQKSIGLGATVLQSAIELSLKHLDANVSGLSIDFTRYSLSELFVSLCVLEKQQWMPISVLSRMWSMTEENCSQVVSLFNSLNLVRETAQENLNGQHECGLQTHDLHHDFCQNEARKRDEKNIWHARLLQGHMPLLSNSSNIDVEREVSLNMMLEHTSQAWYAEDVPNRAYILQSLSRHLREAGLVAELWGVMLDPKWWCAQWRAGDRASLKYDFVNLEEYVRSLASGDVLSAGQCIRSISRSLEASAPVSFTSAQAASYSVLSQLLNEAIKREALSLITKKIQELTPAPCLVPIISAHKSPDKALEAVVNFGPARHVEYSPCGDYLAVLVTKPNRVLLLDSTTRDWVKESTFKIDWDPTFKFASSAKIAVTFRNYKIGVWEWASSETPAVVLQGHTRRVTSIAVSSNGEKLFSSSTDGTVRAWSVAGGPPLQTIPIVGIPLQVLVHEDILAVKTEQDGRGRLEILDPSLDEGHKVRHSCTTDGWGPVAFSRDGRYLAFLYDDAITVVKAAVCTSAFDPLRGHTEKVTCLVFSPDCQRLVSGSRDGTARVWSTRDGAQLGVAVVGISVFVCSVTFHPNGEKIALASWEGAVQFWSVGLIEDGKYSEGGRNEMRVRSFSLSGDGKRVLAISTCKTKNSLSLLNTMDGSEIKEFDFVGYIHRVALDHLGIRAAYGDEDGKVCVWDTEQSITNGKSWIAHEMQAADVSLDRDGTRLMSFGMADDLIRVWDSATGRQLCSISITCLWGFMALSADGDFVIFQSDEEKTKVWRTSTQELLFDSEDSTAVSEDEQKRDTVTSALRSCGPKSGRLWPDSLPRQSGDLLSDSSCRDIYYVSEDEEKQNQSEKVLLASFSSSDWEWQFSAVGGTFARTYNKCLALCFLRR